VLYSLNNLNPWNPLP